MPTSPVLAFVLTLLTLIHRVWQGSTLEGRTAGSYARLASSLLGPGNWFTKCIDSSTSTTIAYAQWSLPLALWERVRAANGGGIQADVTDEMRATFEQERAESCTPDGESKGMRMDVVEFCGPAMSAANRRCFPQDEEYISVFQPSTVFVAMLTSLPQCSPRSRLFQRINAAEPDNCSRTGVLILRIAKV